MTTETHKFEADTGKILNIVINSLYSDKDIFLRELLSNASDAIHKRKFLGQTNQIILNSSPDEITVIVDEKKKIIEIIDTGIGLNEKDLSETLGTIARSGTSSFLDSIDQSADSKEAAKTLIGKFGVGFYSAFMVADRVLVSTRKADEEQTKRKETPVGFPRAKRPRIANGAAETAGKRRSRRNADDTMRYSVRVTGKYQ